MLFGDFESKVNYKQRRYKNEYKLPGVILDECAIDDCEYTQNDSEDDGIVVLTTVPDGIEDKKQDKRRRNEANENDPRAAADNPENDEENWITWDSFTEFLEEFLNDSKQLIEEESLEPLR